MQESERKEAVSKLFFSLTIELIVVILSIYNLLTDIRTLR